MVLFEEDTDGNLHYVKGDDDSGTKLNAQFKVRLVKKRQYLLKIRLYYKNSTGSPAVIFGSVLIHCLCLLNFYAMDPLDSLW